MGKRTSEGYIGIAKQASKGTGVPPTKFAKLSSAESIEMLQEIGAFRELEGDQMISNIVKNIHKPDGTFSFFARPDLAAAIFAWVLGNDTISGAEAPYTHTITHANTIPWLTIEKYLDTVERITDCKINQVVIEGTSGQPISVEVNFLGILPSIETEPATPTYEANDKFLYYHGKGLYKIDDVVVANINSFRITILRNLTSESQTEDFIRSDIVELGTDIDVEFTLKFIDSDFYKKVLYGGSTTAVATLDSGKIEVNFTYGTGVALKGLKIELPSLKHLSAQKFIDPEPAELEMSCIAKAILPSSGEIITVTASNAVTASYI